MGIEEQTHSVHRAVLRILTTIPTSHPIAVACSGGVDSLSLLHVVAQIAKHQKRDFTGIYVHHHLRAEAQEEAKQLQHFCATQQWPLQILHWKHTGISSSVMEKARNARYELLCRFCRENGIGHLLLGHHADDQRETFIMRVLSQSGIEGLKGMVPQRTVWGVNLLRPFLALQKNTLYAYAQQHALPFMEDRSNHNLTFNRARIRHLIAEMPQQDLDRIIKVQQLIQRYMIHFSAWITSMADTTITKHALGYVTWAYDASQPESARLALAKKCFVLMGAPYPPSTQALQTMLEKCAHGTPHTLGGCYVVPKGKNFFFFRELRAIQSKKIFLTKTKILWDGRFCIDFDLQNPLWLGRTLKPVGHEGYGYLKKCGFKRQTIPYHAILALPGLWQGDKLRAVPLLKWVSECSELPK